MDALTRRSQAAVVYSTWAARDALRAEGGLVRSPKPVGWPVRDSIRGDSFLHLGSCLFQKRWLEAVEMDSTSGFG